MIDQQNHSEVLEPGSLEPRNPVEAPAVQVTFFEDRAEVIRRVSVDVPEGTSWLTLLGVTVFVDDSSVLVKACGEGARVLGSRVLRSMREVPEAGDGEIEQMREDLRAARRERMAADQALSRANLMKARLEILADAWTQAVERVPRNAEEAIEAWHSSFEQIDKDLVDGLDEASRHGRSAKLAALNERRARLRLDIAKRVVPDYKAAVEVQIHSDQPRTVELELVYRTPCALWRPEHMACLHTGPDGSQLELQTMAVVWQATGEIWDGVRCLFSTARPARTASPPLLSEDLLTSRRKTDVERKQVVVEVRDEVVAKVGLDRGARQVEEMPGVDDGGEPVQYEASKRCTIVSDGSPFRIELHQQRLRCEVDRVAYPERSEAVHFRATATYTGSSPLLAGPMWIARGSSIVGRSKTGFVGQGEPFELGMGVDDGLRVRRAHEEKRDVTPVIGTQKIRRRVRLYLSNLGGTSRSVQVVERFPVSEVEDVKVEVTSHEGGRVDKRDGLVRYDVDVPGKGTRELLLEYRIEAGSRVVI